MTILEPGQRWLLDRAAEYFPPVRLLLRSSVDLLAQWNCPFPNWDDQQLFAALRQLEASGLIEFFQSSPTPFEEIRVERPELSRKQIVANYRNQRGIYYRLTASGAERWEQAATPDWSVFYKRDHESPSELTAAKDDRPEELIMLYAMSDAYAREALLATAVNHNLLINPGTEQFAPCGPWEATYWKTLPAGVKVTAIACEGVEYYPWLNQLPHKWGRVAGEVCLRFSRWCAAADDPSFCRQSD